MTLGFPVNEGAALGAGYVIKKIDGMKAAATPHSTSSEGTDPVEDTVKIIDEVEDQAATIISAEHMGGNNE